MTPWKVIPDTRVSNSPFPIHEHGAAVHAKLTEPPLSGIPGQNLFFYTNHPIKWVRMAGVVVAIDHYHGRRVYTVDDGSGVNIECAVAVPVTKGWLGGANHAKTGAVDNGCATEAKVQPQVPADLDVGDVVDAKGGVKLFWDQKQIKVEWMVRLGSTDQEVRFWTKVQAFRRDVLVRPWTLDATVVQACRREAEGVAEDRGVKKKTKEKTRDHRAAESRARDRRHRTAEERTKPRPPRITGWRRESSGRSRLDTRRAATVRWASDGPTASRDQHGVSYIHLTKL